MSLAPKKIRSFGGKIKNPKAGQWKPFYPHFFTRFFKTIPEPFRDMEMVMYRRGLWGRWEYRPPASWESPDLCED